jgi:hypothetical protein
VITIHKYELHPGKNILNISEEYNFLSVGSRADKMFTWVGVNTDSPLKERVVRVFATGEEMPEYNIVFIGTVFLFGSSEVYHVFEEIQNIDYENIIGE